METHTNEAAARRLSSASGVTFELNANGSIKRIDFGAVLVNLFPGNELEGGPANLYLRLHRAGAPAVTPLLGPESPLAFVFRDGAMHGQGTWQGLRVSLALVLARTEPAWFWHVVCENTTGAPQTFDVIHAQDLALASYATVRINEYYVSHYVDHTPLEHAECGWVVASRQNLAVQGRNPWIVTGALRRGVAFATDALQVHGPATRAGAVPAALLQGLPGLRRQHEHSMAVVQDAPLPLAPGERAALGFFAGLVDDHPAATSAADLAFVDRTRALPEAQPPAIAAVAADARNPRTLFAPARPLDAQDLDDAELETRFGVQRRHGERDRAGRLLSFFHGADCHVALRAKELAVLRPHGHMLRTGDTLAPDETALTATLWMNGVFVSMLTQGHVSINRLLSTTRSYLGLFRSHGLRVFMETDGGWRLLDVPSAFEMSPHAARWLYRHPGGLLEVRVEAATSRHALELRIDVLAGEATRFLVCHHVALDGDDGSASSPVHYTHSAQSIRVTPAHGSDLARRFPDGAFRIEALAQTAFERVGGDELLFEDGSSRQLPYLCVVTARARSIGLHLLGELVTADADVPASDERTPAMCLPPLPQLLPPAHAPAAHLAELNTMLPWYVHNALVHLLAPRGLEQYSGGGWGTRDVCQGPVELLLALDRPAPVRAMLWRVFRAQSADGDWPQWFMFFERERSIRAGDSHGDIVFWPLLALAQYLLATLDATLLDERVPFCEAGDAGTPFPTLWQHVERALQVIERRRIAGTNLAAFGHGDWNDSLQPADPRLRDHLCSAWTVTLHYQVLTTLADALRGIGRAESAERFAAEARRVRDDFQQRLVPDGVVTGYALFGDDGRVDYLLHPRDTTTGVRYSLLPMMHAVINGMFTPSQARTHLRLIAEHLTGPDGARLFDRPLRYHGGTQKLFQRAETSAFFGREIGVMYTHAHLRYAEALAHAGDADAFFAALCRAHPVGMRSLVASADLRQANCYFSSSDAAFFDRYQALDEYARIFTGEVTLEGGWRIYSSGPGIALGIVVRHLLGLRRAGASLVFDPVMPLHLDGMRARIALADRDIEVHYRLRATHGPTALRLNGQPLAFTRAAHPYRTGGAVVALADFVALCAAAGGDVLEIDAG